MGRFQPALLGGLFIGVLSSLPVVSMGNCCCCLWVVSGGVLTTYLLQQRQLEALPTPDAVLGGLLAGVIGAVIAGVVGAMLAVVFGAYQQEMMMRAMQWVRGLPDLPPEAQSQIDEMIRNPPDVTVAGQFVQFVIWLPISAVFSMLGGLLGLAFFRKQSMPAGA